MAIKEKSQRIERGDFSHEALTMALAILVERIRGLPKEDRDDLFQLVKGLQSAETCEEMESIETAMREILEQAPIRARPMEQSEPQPGPGLKKWMDFVSGKIRALRQKANLTQEQLATKSGLPQSHISRLENGQHSPSHATLKKIAAALGVPVSDLDPSA